MVWMSPLLCLAHAAAVTQRLRLAMGILVRPYSHPVTLARQIQTLHHLSGGRFVLGAGPGWDEHEFAMLGMRLSERGGRTDESLAALSRRALSGAGRCEVRASMVLTRSVANVMITVRSHTGGRSVHQCGVESDGSFRALLRCASSP
jgi:alkanesulfonate monooxygenase SsuD/methylene tetrahydromethanopterin reductase-like flavin-dependent oxidoreductase (luciferase family)